MQKIAVVDDSEDNRDFMEFLLREQYKVVLHASGETALQSLKSDTPDLVLMDISLDGRLDGFETLRRMRSDGFPNIPVIALTAHAMVGDRERILAAGFNDYVSKPIIDVDLLYDIIKRHLR
jgi:CheY-like chemotaxis protein